jgi:hypothetical protein
MALVLFLNFSLFLETHLALFKNVFTIEHMLRSCRMQIKKWTEFQKISKMAESVRVHPGGEWAPKNCNPSLHGRHLGPLWPLLPTRAAAAFCDLIRKTGRFALWLPARPR